MISIVLGVFPIQPANPLLLNLYGKTSICLFCALAQGCAREWPISHNSATSAQSGSIEESVRKRAQHIQSALIGFAGADISSFQVE